MASPAVHLYPREACDRVPLGHQRQVIVPHNAPQQVQPEGDKYAGQRLYVVDDSVVHALKGHLEGYEWRRVHSNHEEFCPEVRVSQDPAVHRSRLQRPPLIDMPRDLRGEGRLGWSLALDHDDHMLRNANPKPKTLL